MNNEKIIQETAKMGRPKKEINWELLDALAVWASQEYCAEKLGVSVKTLQRNIKEKFGDESTFDQYRHKRREPMRVNLFKKQYDVAMAGNVSMLIFLGKNYLGQSDKQEIKQEITEVPAFEVVDFE